MKKTTPSQENYIEQIYRMLKKGPVQPSRLAERLGVSRPSATKFVATLVRDGFVLHKPHGDIKLTKAGRALAKAIIRRNECLTKLLVTICGMPQEAAKPEVHRLEHVISDDVLVRLEILTDLAGSSTAWLKRLHHRIEKSLSKKTTPDAFVVGSSQIHQGENNP